MTRTSLADLRKAITHAQRILTDPADRALLTRILHQYEADERALQELLDQRILSA